MDKNHKNNIINDLKFKLPLRFQWFEPKIVAVSFRPDEKLLQRYKNEGIKHIINLTEFDYFSHYKIDLGYTHIPISDGSTMSDDQIKQGIKILNQLNSQNIPFLIHCAMGCGRTGMMLVLWGYLTGKISDDEDPVEWARKRRPCCLDNNEQEKFARELKNKLKTLNI